MIFAKADERPVPPEPTFPAIFYAVGTYILATGYANERREELVGTVLKSKIFPVGSHNRSWSATEFARYNGSITLSNQD